MRRVGAHVTISPQPIAAVDEAEALGINTIQIFTHNPRGWQFKDLDEKAVATFREAVKAKDISPVVSHCNYLINLATTDSEQWQKSLACFKKELVYAKAFGCNYFVLHVGKHKGVGVAAGIARVIEGITVAGKELIDSGVMLLLETVAGQGTEVGVDFKDLNKIIDVLPTDLGKRVGVCLDTCHIHAAGYDITNKKGVDATLAAIKESFGAEKIRVIHVNDAKGELGGHLDRHAHIGEGYIGAAGFKEFLNRPEIKDIPLILETPWDDEKSYPEDLAALRKLLS